MCRASERFTDVEKHIGGEEKEEARENEEIKSGKRSREIAIPGDKRAADGECIMA